MTQPLNYPDWREIVSFSSDGVQPQILVETDTFKAVLVGIRADQTIPLHPGPVSAYHVLQGTGWFIIGEERIAAGPGATVIVPTGASRGLEAKTQMVFMGTQAKDTPT